MKKKKFIEIMGIVFIDEIEKYLKKASEIGILNHLRNIFDLIFHPRLFWHNYNQMPVKDKITQYATYGALFLFFVWLTAYDSLTLRELLRILTMEIMGFFPYFFIVYLGNIIISRREKALLFSFVFCCYIKFIFCIPELLFLRLYYETESPIIMAFSFFIPIIVELIILIYSVYVWQIGKKKIISAILTCILLLNLYDCVFIFTGWSKPFIPNYGNKIAKERFELGKSLKNAYEIPTYVCSHSKGKDIWYLYTNPFDSIASNKFGNVNGYIDNVKQDIDSLKSIVNRARFRTNKDFFNQLYILKKEIVYVHETQSFKSSPIIGEKQIYEDSILRDIVTYQEFDRELFEMNSELIENETEIVEQYEMARYPNYFGCLWHPCLFIHMLYNKQEKCYSIDNK